MKMNTIELNIDKYESMLKEIGVLKTENEDLKKRLLTSHNSDCAKCGCGSTTDTDVYCQECLTKIADRIIAERYRQLSKGEKHERL